MKTFKFVAPIVAFLFAIAGAFASNTSEHLVINGWHFVSSTCTPGSMPDQCTLTEGSRCQINSVNAFQDENCLIEAYRPIN